MNIHMTVMFVKKSINPQQLIISAGRAASRRFIDFFENLPAACTSTVWYGYQPDALSKYLLGRTGSEINVLRCASTLPALAGIQICNLLFILFPCCQASGNYYRERRGQVLKMLRKGKTVFGAAACMTMSQCCSCDGKSNTSAAGFARRPVEFGAKTTGFG